MFSFNFIWKSWMQLWSFEIVRVLVASIAAHSSSISVGITQGYSAVLLPQLTSPESSIFVTTDEASWIASLGVISTPFGALLSGLLVDVFGRKSMIIIMSLPCLAGWVLTAFAEDVRLLYVGRAISGFAAGVTTIAFLYIAEITSKEHRSVMSALGSIAVSLGVLIAYTLGFLTTWQRAALISASFSVVTVVCMLSVPESPSWSVSRNDISEAKKALSWLRPNAMNADLELSNLISSKAVADEVKAMRSGEKLKVTPKMVLTKMKGFGVAALSPAIYKPFLILLFFFAFQEGSGIYIFLFYSNQIFKEFGTDYDENLISVSVGIFRFLMSILGAVLMAKIGRRPLAVFSGACMSASLLTVSVYQFLNDSWVPAQSYQFLPFISVLFYVGFSMTGFLQLPWIMASEMFPAENRGFLSGTISSLGYFLIFITVKIYPNLLSLLTLQGLLWAFFVMTCVGTLFVHYFLPETKDKSLEEITMGFMGGKTADAEAGNAPG